jgi:urocanate hydratase
LRARNWRTEGLLRAFENVLEVGENPAELIVYASLGKAARNWAQAKRIAQALLELQEDQTLVLQSGAAVGVLQTSPHAPKVISAVNNTVGRWSDSERFYSRAKAGLTIWGGLTAGAWQYIGRQGVLQGTYELLRIIAERHFGGAEPSDVKGRWLLTSGLGGMGSSQPISARLLGLSSITVEADPDKIVRAKAAGVVDVVAGTLAEALAALHEARASERTIAIALEGNAADIYQQVVSIEDLPSFVTDQTAAHDARYGYIPSGYTVTAWHRLREEQSEQVERDARASIATEVEAMLQLQAAGAVVFENGNNLRVQALEHLGAKESDRVAAIPGFMEYLRPAFSRGIGPFRWIALSGDPGDLAVLDDLAADLFRPEVTRWINLARTGVPTQGLPARSCWLGHGERSEIAARANELYAAGRLKAPILFTRDHLDAAGMTNPRIGTENMRDGSDGVTDWPLLDALALAASGADLVAIHSGGGGYSGWMQSAGVSVIADGTSEAETRVRKSLDADTSVGILRYATAGYEDAAHIAAESDLLTWFDTEEAPNA